MGSNNPSDDVLRTISNNDAPGQELDDVALAKLLQEQERAMYLMLGGGGGPENAWAALSADDAALEAELIAEASGAADIADGSGAGAGGASEADAQAVQDAERATGSGSGGEGEGPLDDLELARRLQEEEIREHNARMLAMAGFGGEPEAEAGIPDEDEDEEGYESEDSLRNMSYEALTALGEVVGKVSKGLPQAAIDALPVVQYASDAPVGTFKCEECAVCRCEYEAGEQVKLLPCKHAYHPECIQQWLQINKVCPMCNQEVAAAPAKAS